MSGDVNATPYVFFLTSSAKRKSKRRHSRQLCTNFNRINLWMDYSSFSGESTKRISISRLECNTSCTLYCLVRGCFLFQPFQLARVPVPHLAQHYIILLS